MERNSKMTDYKPWFQNISSFEEVSSEEEIDYKSEYERMLKENKTLCSMIGKLSSYKSELTIQIEKLYIEVNELSIEIHELKSSLVDKSLLSNDCSTAVKELLEIVKDNPDFKYTCHRHGGIENAYYSIINTMGITIFFLEDHSENNFNGLGGSALITTPSPSGIVEGYKHKYASVTGDWDKRTTLRSTRKKYDIRGKKVMDVIDILNTFR